MAQVLGEPGQLLVERLRCRVTRDVLLAHLAPPKVVETTLEATTPDGTEVHRTAPNGPPRSHTVATPSGPAYGSSAPSVVAGAVDRG
ncbi:hypothetical protein GCM10009738_87680 [Kitasatospora viridis]